MKKVFFVSVMILTILTSVVAGTMANYTTKIDNIAAGSVVGKEFIFLEDGQDTFKQNVKIAPTETVVWKFAVKNHDKGIITETDLYYKITFDVFATPGKTAIEPLVVTVKDMTGKVINSITGTGLLEVNGFFPLHEQGQRAEYTVEIYWPSNSAIDINYAGSNYSTSINVGAIASQLPIENENPDPDPDPDPDPINSDISVLYKTTKSWRNNNNGSPEQYEFEISITNNTNQPIDGWKISFNMDGEIRTIWNAHLVEKDNTGYYQYSNIPHYQNRIIPPHGTVTFSGHAYGSGNTNITNVKVNGELIHVKDFIPHTLYA